MPHSNTNTGTVFVLGEMMKGRVDRYGYHRVTFCVKGKRTNHSVHRLVAKAFIPNPESKPQVNHKDGNKLNNSVANLEWCTNEENQKHAAATGLTNKGRKHSYKCVRMPNRKPVIQIDLNGVIVAIYNGATEAKADGYNPSYVGMCCRGEITSYKKYKWQFANVTKAS